MTKLNVCQELALRELGGRSGLRSADNHPRRNVNVDRHSSRILRLLIESKNTRKFVAYPQKSLISQGQTLYDDGKLFLRNNATKTHDCHSIRDASPTQDMSKTRLYSLATRPRWRDQDTWTVSGLAKPTLFVLREDNTLNVLDMSRRGLLMQSVYLSKTAKFMELSTEAEGLSVKSTKSIPGSCGGCHSRLGCHCHKETTYLSFVTFTYPPLKFQAHLELNRSIFGANMVDAEINQGLLFVMHSDSTVRIYSMEYILQNFMDHHYKIGDSINDPERFDLVVGEEPVGFPINVHIKARPPLLFQVKSHHHHLSFGTIRPFLFVTCEADRHYKVFHMTSKSVLGNGMLPKKPMMDDDVIQFHPDDSSRLIHMTGSRIRILNIQGPDEQGKFSLKECYNYSSSPQRTLQEKTTTTKEEDDDDISSEDDLFGSDRHEVVFAYDDELDIFAVLSAVEFMPDTDDDDVYMKMRLEQITLLDNQSLEVIRTIHIGKELRCGSDQGRLSLVLDRDLLLIRVRTSIKTTTFVYRLFSDQDCSALEEDMCGKKKTSFKKPVVFLRNNRKKKNVRKLRRRSTWNEPFYLAQNRYSEDEEEEEINETTRTVRTRASSLLAAAAANNEQVSSNRRSRNRSST